MSERYATIDSSIQLISISQGLTGKMTGMPAITTSSLCNQNCKKNALIKGSVCEHCYSKKYLASRQKVRDCYEQNSILLSSEVIPTKQLPFINATLCRLESFGDIINATHLENYVRLARKNNHCIFSLFTKRYDLIVDYFKTHKQPSNLSIVISSLLLNKPIETTCFNELKNVKVFTVYERAYAEKHNVVIDCGKSRCIDCRRCYSKNKSIVHVAEILK